MLGSLIQLVAYGAQHTYICNSSYENTNNKKVRFFYKKIKNRKTTKEKVSLPVFKSKKKIIKKYNENNIKNTIKNTKPKQKLIINQKQISEIKKVILQNIEFNSLVYDITKYRHIVFRLKGNNRYTMINKLVRLNDMLLNQIVLQKIGRFNFSKNRIIISMIGNKLSKCINKHYNIIKKYDISNRIISTPIKNEICSITFNEINNLYFECNVCNECYDYENTYKWFTAHQYCACCRSPMNLKPKHRFFDIVLQNLIK